MTAAKTYDIAVFGEAMLLLIADRPGPLERVQTFTKGIAGAEINVAVGLSRLGFDVRWFSRVGADSMGRYLVNHLCGEGVNCEGVAMQAAQRTGFQFKGQVDDGSDPVIEYHRKGSAASLMTPADVDESRLAGARHLHATGVFPAISETALATARRTLQVARDSGSTISFDPNLRPTLWPDEATMRREINALAAGADWVLPGLAEGALLTGQASPEAIARFYRDLGASLVVVKLGADGAYYDHAELGCGHVPGCPVQTVVDTVGAGDAFAVGVISGLLDGLAAPEAVARACWIGARQVQVRGDSEGLPSRAELQAAGH